jgi:hypothetical protein
MVGPAVAAKPDTWFAYLPMTNTCKSVFESPDEAAGWVRRTYGIKPDVDVTFKDKDGNATSVSINWPIRREDGEFLLTRSIIDMDRSLAGCDAYRRAPCVRQVAA